MRHGLITQQSLDPNSDWIALRGTDTAPHQIWYH